MSESAFLCNQVIAALKNKAPIFFQFRSRIKAVAFLNGWIIERDVIWEMEKNNVYNCYLFHLGVVRELKKLAKLELCLYLSGKVSLHKIHSSLFWRIGLSVLHVDFCQRFQKLIMTQLDSIKSLTSVIFGTFLETSVVTESQKKKQTEKLKCQNILFSDFSSLLILNIQNLAESCAKNIGTEWASQYYGHFPISVYPN